MRRVVITGLGMVTPLGLSTKESWQNALLGKSGVRPIDPKLFFDPSSHDVQIAGFNPDFDGVKILKGLLPKDEAGEDTTSEDNPQKKKLPSPRRMPRSTQMAIVAGFEAMKQSGLVITPELADDFGLYLGTGGGATDLYMDATRTIDAKGPSRVSAFYSFQLMPNNAAAMGALIFGANGPVVHVSSACCTGNDAMRLAYQEIVLGRCKVVMTGGTEAAINSVVIASFANARALTKEFNDNPTAASRPFTLTRSGFVWGEGSVVFIFEELDHAQARGANILGEVLAAYATDDSFHETAPQPEGIGAQKAMRGALKQASLEPEEIDLLSLHGTSTPLNDKTESLAINRVFGERAPSIPAFANKSRAGHLIGASGPYSIAECLLSLRDKVVPPTLNYDDPDPDCQLNLSAKVQPLPVGSRIGLNNNAGFGGHNTCIIVSLFAR